MMFPILFRSIQLLLIDLYTTDETIFDDVVLPEGIDKQTFVDSLLFVYGQLPIVYTEPAHVKKLVEIWSRRRCPVWEKLYNTTQLEYDPIENYNRTEEYTDTRDKSNTGTDTRETQNNANGTVTRGTKNTIKNEYTDNTENTAKSTAFNSDALKVTGTSTVAANGNSTYTSENSGTDESTDKNNGTDNRTLDLHENEKLVHNAHLYGNIGVTTSQQMIKEEREVSTYDIYSVIMSDFAENFLILVY